MKTTKGGKVMNPTDAFRKEQRRKELKRVSLPPTLGFHPHALAGSWEVPKQATYVAMVVGSNSAVTT